MEIVYTPESVADLIRLREFIEIKNPQAAQKVAHSIIKGVKKLKQFPKIGIEVSKAPVPDLMRDLVIGNYIARYLIGGSTIYILRVWHHKEDDRSDL